jgi:hypothetical protein
MAIIAAVAEKHFARAKDYEQLYKAVEMKLIEQRKYALWRATVRPKGGRQYSDPSVLMVRLPDTDPGEQAARRWRILSSATEALCQDGRTAAVPSVSGPASWP